MWTASGPRFDVLLAELRKILQDESDLIVEHRFFHGARAPFRFVCGDYDQLVAYVRDHARPGDAFVVWRFEECCRDDNVADRGKMPDADGRVPEGGAY